MNNIKFPGLNLDLNIDNIAFKIGDISIHWYAIFIVIGFSLALLFIKRDKDKFRIKFDDIFNLTLLVIPISLISARIYYVLFKWDSYKDNLLEIFNVRNGGLAIYGGIIGAVITIIAYCKVKKINILNVLDRYAPYLPLGQAIGRWGNFFNVEAYGEQTTNIFRMGIMENGNYIEVHPTFLYESICNFLIFFLLFKLRNKRKFDGELTFVYLTLYAIARTIIEGLRTDSLMLGCFRISQILSIILFMVFGSVLLYKYYRLSKKKKDI